MKYDTRAEHHGLQFSPFKSCAVPRPIGWISTISKAGTDNLAPYSQWQNLTYDPPMVMFSANRYEDGRQKDTVINAIDTGWFVWNMATYDLRHAVSMTGAEYPPGLDEFEITGLEKRQSSKSAVKMVNSSPVHFECSYHSSHTIRGDSPIGTVDVVFARVEVVHIADEVILPNGKLDILTIRPLARLGYYDYTSVTEIFEMKTPGINAANASSLEGAVVR